MDKTWSFGLLLFGFMMIACEQEDINKDATSFQILEGENLELFVGDTAYLHFKYYPENSNPTALTWGDYDHSIVYIHHDKNRIVARKRGTTSLTLYTNDKSSSATCNINVSPIAVSFSDTARNLYLRDSYTLQPIFSPNTTTAKRIEWMSSNLKVADVDKYGNVTGRGEGESTITMKAFFGDDEGISTSCNFFVVPHDMTSLQLSETRQAIEIGKKFNLTASFEPTNASYKQLFWSSSDENVATVTKGEVSATGIGECIISVTNRDSSLTAQCEVSVFAIEMTAISCLEEKTLEQYEQFKLDATFEPSNATTYGEALRWHSSDDSIATVVNDTTGEVNCVGIGECTITVSNIYNSVTASCRLTVLPVSVKSLSLNYSSKNMLVGTKKKLSYTITPDNAANKEVKWESSDNSVATVSEDGTVTAISEGEAIIKVTALDGSGCSAECHITVMNKKDYADYVEDYIENKMSIINVGGSGIIINGIPQSGYSWSFRVYNNGDEKVYLKEVRGYGSSSSTVSINKYIEPGGSYSGSFNTTSIDWVFELNGIEVVRRY